VLVFSVAVAFWASALNVRYRDVQHLIGLGLLVWFWLTPIVYAAGTVHDVLMRDGPTWGWYLFLLNPMAWVVFGFQGALYHSADASTVLAPMTDGQLAAGIGIVILVSTVLLYGTWRLFFSMSGDFAEEL
jgi:ABC-2 type transport system permease protein